jgi:SAM-dependent methyltransferase
MNKEEILAKENKENYELYLKRMTESMKYSTKGFLPFFANNSKCALDVGCGSGVMLKALLDYGVEKVIGIDINSEAIKKLESLNDDRISLYTTSFEDFVKDDIHPDTIVFSSILHELSSYHQVEELRYSLVPIRDAIQEAYNILPSGGRMIIRDCLMTPYEDRNRKTIITFNDVEDGKLLYKFKDEFQGFRYLDVDMSIEQVDEKSYKISYIFLKEFLYTYTWGPGSWNREINERTGVMDSKSWESMIKEAGFEIDDVLYSREEYEKYLSPKVSIKWGNGDEFVFPYMNILLVAVKK